MLETTHTGWTLDAMRHLPASDDQRYELLDDDTLRSPLLAGFACPVVHIFRLHP